MQLRTEAATPQHWPDIEALFGKTGACGGCWCQAWRIEKGEDWDAVKGPAAKERLRKGIQARTTQAILAYDGTLPVGWCTFGPRGSFPRLDRARTLRCDDADSVWSIPCFYIARGHRGKGVATAMLEHALRVMQEQGVRIAEGYPTKPNKNGLYIAAFSWTGTLSLFEKIGFEVVGSPDAGKVRMRKFLSRLSNSEGEGPAAHPEN